MAAKNAILPQAVDGNNPQEVHDFCSKVTSLIDRPIGRVSVSAGAKVGNVRSVTLQVVDRLRYPRAGHWAVVWFVSTTAEGDPGGTQTVAAPSAGTTLGVLIADKAFQTLTDATGKIVVDITQAGAATLYIHAAALGRCEPPKDNVGLAW